MQNRESAKGAKSRKGIGSRRVQWCVAGTPRTCEFAAVAKLTPGSTVSDARSGRHTPRARVACAFPAAKGFPLRPFAPFALLR
jgi:hypothetical protein